MPTSRTRSVLLLGGGLLWLVLVGTGLWWFTRESFTPSLAGSPAELWPADSGVPANPSPGGHTLVLALHPECPCSRATVEELGALLATCGDRLQARVLMVQYAALPRPVEETALWKQAASLPGVRLQADPEGVESRRFAMRTSGETRLYDTRGRLVFHGGITVSRGHAGPNPGRDAINSLVSKTRDAAPSAAAPAPTPVFGCSL